MMSNQAFDDIPQSFGRDIRHTRLSLGHRQEFFTRLVGLHHTYVSAIERAERNPSLRNLVRFSQGLNVKLSRLIAQAEEDESGVGIEGAVQ